MVGHLQYTVVRILILLSLQGMFITVAAQQEKIDSLRSLLPGKTDLERADIFYELASEYVELNYALGLEYSKRSFHFAKRAADSLRMVKAGRTTAFAFRRLGEMDSSLIVSLEMLPIASRNFYNKQVKQLLRGIALAYTYKANYDLGLKYNFELLKITEQDKDSIEMSYVLNNVGIIYYKFKNYERALWYYHRAEEVKSPLDKYPRTSMFLNISLCYSARKEFSKANVFIKKGMDACQPECQSAFLIEGLRARGVFNFFKENFDSAEVYFLKAYSLAKKSGRKRDHLNLADDLIEVYFKVDKISAGAKYLSEAESIMEQTPFEHELFWLYSRFSFFYKRTGDEQKRVFYQEKYIQLMDSIYGRRLSNNLIKLEGEYLERANKAKISEQEQLLELKDQVIGRQNSLNALIVIITVLLIALLYILYRSNRQRKSANRLLEKKVRERTRALESSHLALKQSFENEDSEIATAFMEIKSSTTVIKELCASGLALDGHDVESRKYLGEIWTVTERVLLALKSIHGNGLKHDEFTQ